MNTFRTAFALAACLAAFPALSVNHDRVVAPLAPGKFTVACSNLAIDTARLAALGGTAEDFFEGKEVAGAQRYITEILAHPQAVVRFDALVPDVRRLYPQFAGALVPHVAIVCHPTPRNNPDPDYALPGTAGTLPHMLPAGATPRLLTRSEHLGTLGLPVTGDGNSIAALPTIVYSHGLGGSPVGKGYIDVMTRLAAHGYVVAAVFHADARFSRVRIEDLDGFLYFLANFSRVAEMQLMRPVALKAMTDTVLASGYAPAVDTTRIGGFGASLGGQAMAHLLGARMTTSLTFSCGDTVRDPRIRAAVGFVPYAGQSFLPAFCDNQEGADEVNKPYLALAGTSDTTAPIGLMRQALNRMGSSRYMVELRGGEHELRVEDIDDLFTWMVTFLNAYLEVPTDPTAMARFIRQGGVSGGRVDELTVDVHVPFASGNGESLALEFYNTDLQHYFFAAGADEIANIVAGNAGRSWELTGEAIKVFPRMPSDTFTGVAPVCRFYGAAAGGPNSHFFTSDAPECELVKRSGGWFYEGIGFYMLPAAAGGGGCPDGWLSVNRAYNNGFARNDSNHRFSTSESTMAEMRRKGWAVEGTAMCARP